MGPISDPEILEVGCERPGSRALPRLLAAGIVISCISGVVAVLARDNGAESPTSIERQVGATAKAASFRCSVGSTAQRVAGPLVGLALRRVPGGSVVPGYGRVVRNRGRQVHEVRYGADDLGATGRVLGGLVFTGVYRSDRFDRWITTAEAQRWASVGGHATYFTTRFGGNGALIWQPSKDTIAYVGYSGSASSPQTNQALHCLAVNAEPLTRARWKSLMHSE